MSKISGYTPIVTVHTDDVLIVDDVHDEDMSSFGTTKRMTISQLLLTDTFTQPFSAVSTVSVTHNLQKYPAVTIVNSSDDVIIGDIIYTSVNTLTVNFSVPVTGTVICN